MDDSHSLGARDYRFFEYARKIAFQSDFKTRIGAVAVYSGKVIASAASSEKTNPLQKKYNRFRNFTADCIDSLPKVHAEIGIMSKLKRMQGVDFKRVTVYVFRLCKARDMGLARPCEACRRALMDLGIRNIYYSTDSGFAREWLGADKEFDKYKKAGG